jgi:hypothetical protein
MGSCIASFPHISLTDIAIGLSDLQEVVKLAARLPWRSSRHSQDSSGKCLLSS